MSTDRHKQRFQDVVLPYLDDALTLARWLSCNAADAEDIVQEACIRAFRALDTQQGGSPRAWLLAIVRNTAYSWLTKNRPKVLLVTSDDSVFEAAGHGAGQDTMPLSPEATLIARADIDQLHRQISSLPIAFRETLVLREIEELSYREISELLSIPVGTVMSRLARARSLLAARMTQIPAEEKGKSVA